MFHTSVMPYISLDQYFNPNLYTIPNMQNMRIFCCSVYVHFYKLCEIHDARQAIIKNIQKRLEIQIDEQLGHRYIA